MKTLHINKLQVHTSWAYLIYSAIACILLWHFVPKAILEFNETAGMIDASIWLLLLFSIICFISLSLICCWLFHCLFIQLGFPKINDLVSQFKTLQLWQQFALYWASFALLFMGSMLSLIAVF